MGRSPKTLYEYRRKIDKSIRPDLGATRLDKLTAHDLDKLYARQLAAGLSPSTVLMHHRIIGAALSRGGSGDGSIATWPRMPPLPRPASRRSQCPRRTRSGP